MKLEQLTETLIDIESVTGNEQEILTFIEDYLNKNKFTGEIIKNDGGFQGIRPKILKIEVGSCADKSFIQPKNGWCLISREIRSIL